MVATLTSAVLLLVIFMTFMEVRKKQQLRLQVKENNRCAEKNMRFLDTIFQNIHVYVFLIDKNFLVLKTNYYRQAAKKDTLKAGRMGEVFCCRNAILSGQCGTHENCKRCAIRNEITKALQSKQDFREINAQLTVEIAENTYVQLQTTVAGTYMEFGEEESMLLTIHNVTNLVSDRSGHEKLHRIVTNTSPISHIGFASLNLKSGEEVIISEYCINLGEKADEKAITIFSNFQYVHDDDKKELLSCIGSAREGKIDPLGKDIRVMAAAGKWKWVRIYLLQDETREEESPAEIYSVSIDISDRKELEEELDRGRTRAEQANKSKSMFLANMSHEIRTPLSAIIGFSELIAAEGNDEEKGEYLQILKSSSEMLLQLINDILDMAKIEAGIIEFAYTDVNVNTLMLEVERLFKFRIKDNKEIKINYDTGPPSLYINTDRNRIAQVLSNFMANAINFTEKGSITFGYKQTGDGIYFYVTDTGLGLNEEMREHVFDRYSRFHKGKKGNGLGLLISKTIIERLGGVIGVDSVYREGSTFWFLLPEGAKTREQRKNISEHGVLPVSQNIL